MPRSLGHFFELPLGADALMAEAKRITGIDIVDEEAVAPLEVLVKSFNAEGELHERGAIAMQKNLVRFLCNRLRMFRDFAKYPEILEQELLTPTIILGLTRTGSTKTQKTLAASGDFNWLSFWQSWNPSLYTGSRDESPQPRIDDADAYTRWFDRMTPEAKHIHALNTHEPEEEIFVLTQSLRTFGFTGYAPLPSFIQWLFAEDMGAPVRFVRDTLKYLQWQGYADAEKPWILKTPIYLGMENALKEVFPGCKIVMTHRDLNNVIPSTLSLFSAYRKPYTDREFDYHSMITELGQQLQLHLVNRRNNPGLNILDIDYRELTSSVESVVEKIYAHSGMILSKAARDRIQTWERENPKNKHGIHRYSLATFKLTEDQIQEAFSDYLSFQKQLF